MRWMKAAAIRRGMICSAGFACLLLAGCGGAASRYASHMERGRAYFAKEDYVHARIEFRNAIQISPKDGPARIMAARTDQKLGEVREAAGLYQSVIDGSPENLEARAGLGNLLLFVGADEQALKVIEPGLAKHPDEVSLLSVRAAARARTRDLSGAVADADHALKLAPLNEIAIGVRAGLYQQSGNTAQAIALVSNGVQHIPSSTDLREVLAQLYLSAGEQDLAEKQLQALIRLRPAELRYRKLLAVFYSRAHKLDDAQRTLEEAVRALPKNDDAKLTLVGFISTQRTRAQGEKTLQAFIAQQPDNYDLRFGLAELRERAGATKEALDTYNEIIRLDGTGPKGLQARDRIAAIDIAQGRDADAHKLIEDVLSKNPRDSDALLVRGELVLKGRDPSAAIADLRAALRDSPGSVPIERLLARAHIANGEPALAEQALRSAIDVAPTDMNVRLQLAQLYAQTGRDDQAIGLLEDSVRRDPTNVQIREALAIAYLAKRDFQAARGAADDLKTLRPDSAMAVYFAGLADQGLNKLADAQQELERAHALSPHAIEPLTALAQLEVARGQSAQAIALVQSAVSASEQKDPAPLNLLGELYVATGDVPHAVEALTRATAIAPKWWPAYRNLALAKSAAKDTEGAIAAYDAAIRIAPGETQLVAELGRLYESVGRVDDAIAHYEELYKRNPGQQLVANNLAMLLVTYKKDQRSLDRARDLAAGFASSNSGSLLDTNGWVHYKRGEYAQALPVLERAAELAPDTKEIRYHLGVAELQAGQTDRARKDLELALSGSVKTPWADDARTALAGIRSRTG